MKSSLFTSIIVVLFLISILAPVFAGTPELLNYQGRLTNTSGDPVNGSVAIRFLIYDVPAAGSSIWSETQSVDVTDGVYQVLLGSSTPFPENLFTASIDRYLEIIISGETLTPRTRFTSVSYAFQTLHSDSADVAASAAPTGLAAGDLNGNYPNPTVDALQGRAVSSTAPGADQILKWTGSAWAPADDVSGGGSIWQTSGSNIYFNTGNVGIGKTNPTTPLDVTGTVTATTFAGSGAPLTNLNGTNVSSGTVADARLESTIDRTIFNASDYITADGGIHVGGTSDPGTNNLIVDGNIGKGVANPANPLHIKANGSDAIRLEENLGTEFFDIGIDNNGNLEFQQDDGTVAMTIEDGTGHVGIGTDPSYPLHIYTGTNNTRGLFIDNNGTATSNSYGLYIDHDNFGSGFTYGARIDVDNTHTGNSWIYGVNSTATNNSGTYGCYGIYGESNGTSTGNKIGVYGRSVSGNGIKYGVWGYASGTTTATKIGVYGNAVSSTAGTKYGVFGTVSGGTGSTYGVRGENSTIYGYLAGNLRSLQGFYDGSHWGYIGSATHAGYFSGDVQINGTLSKTAGSFKIDHPLDPANKYLIHSFVESPDMKNIYDGVIILDSNGEGTIEFADWFGELNMDFRYQLTAIGAPGPNLYISEEIANNQFKIAGGSAGMKVSWQVTGIRNDAYARANRIKVEEDKVGKERGKYLHPELFGSPDDMRIEVPSPIINNEEE